MPREESNTDLVTSLNDDMAALSDVLLPGGDGWPSGSMVGIQHSVLMRLLDKGGQAALEQLARVLAEVGAPFSTLTVDQRIAGARHIELSHSAMFSWLKSTSFYAYYENPVVVAKIASSGTPYQMSPHQNGYDLPKFDLSTQTPRHGRGYWIKADDVRTVDPSIIGLERNTTENWGLQR